MTKREMIDEILSINISAEPRFLARFADDQLSEYLTHLHVLSKPRLTGVTDRYDKYFRDLPKVAARPQWRTDTQQAEKIIADDLDQANQADDFCLEEETIQNDAPEASHDDELFVQSSYTQELLANDVDLAVGLDEREQLLAVSDDLDCQEDDQQEPDEAEMEPPFKIVSSPRSDAAPPTNAASNAAQVTPYSTDSTQAPAGQSANHTNTLVQAHATATATPPNQAPENEQDDSWLY